VTGREGLPERQGPAPVRVYHRDVPDFAGPDGVGLLQVLWCPLADGPVPGELAECGTTMTLLFTAGSTGWHGDGRQLTAGRRPGGCLLTATLVDDRA
jgi:hypothetical protein